MTGGHRGVHSAQISPRFPRASQLFFECVWKAGDSEISAPGRPEDMIWTPRFGPPPYPSQAPGPYSLKSAGLWYVGQCKPSPFR